MTLAQGLGQELDPDFDLFAFSKPNVEKILEKKYKPSSILFGVCRPPLLRWHYIELTCPIDSQES
jgi:predicted unusual protein kinase regulating ubiquinone biosynthesis (AarF/ABC1/UbiB family)